MSRYPITNVQFDLFVKDPQGYANNQWWTKDGLKWRGDRKEPDKRGGIFDLPNHPVVYVRWYEAVAYCKWLTEQFQVSGIKCQVYDLQSRSIVEDANLQSQIVNRKLEIRLPTEAEWEKAARGTQGLRYPWGNEISPRHANYADTNIGATSAVGIFPDGKSPYGLLDMSGNVWEWCATKWTEDGYKTYEKNENNSLEGNALRVLRGGAFFNGGGNVRCAYRLRSFPDFRNDFIGFRVVLSEFSHFS
jgi:formylglycine-generating enzyme required for sulfatase activity